jgi:membrane-bound metal-dependent hydrolase YbcI (DUF457 family)
VDLLTYALASFALARGLFSRADKLAALGTVFAGCLASLDELSSYFGAPAALVWRGTYLHSLLTAVAFALVPLVVFVLMSMGGGTTFVPASQLGSVDAQPQEPTTVRKIPARDAFLFFFLAPLCAALLHVALGAFQSQGVMLLWPFSSKRFATDWTLPLDPWILTILILAVAVPELLHLVSSEIGAKSKKPRGRTGALIGLALLAAYLGARAMLHSNAVALMESRAFHGESARRIVAFPEALSLVTWHGIAETESALDQIDVNLAATASFDPDTSFRIFKPEPSPTLTAARNTRVAQQFLAAAQMPRASVEKTDVGYVVILRDLRYAALGDPRHEIVALIELDPANQVTSQEIMWARELRGSF